jgi:hypothetical protein
MDKHQKLSSAAEAQGLHFFDDRCVDCGIETTPYYLDGDGGGVAMQVSQELTIRVEPGTWEFYCVKDRLWAEAGMTETAGCLCVECLENRLGRRLRPKDFDFERDENLPGEWASPGLARRRKDRERERECLMKLGAARATWTTSSARRRRTRD